MVKTGRFILASIFLLYLIVIASAQTRVDLVKNGGFETGQAPWEFGDTIITRISHSGNNAAALGLIDNENDTLFQDIFIPQDATNVSLSFWLNIDSDEPRGSTADVFTVEILDTSNRLLKTVTRFTSADQQELGVFTRRGDFSLSEFAGRSIRLLFRGVTDFSDSSTFRVDDVSLMANVGAGSVSRANIQISFDNNTVGQDTAGVCSFPNAPSWNFTVFITELNGVAFRIDRISADVFDGVGNFINNFALSTNDFLAIFNNCGPATINISASGRVCGKLCANLGGRSTGSLIFNLSGVDSRGNLLTFTSQKLVLDGPLGPEISQVLYDGRKFFTVNGMRFSNRARIAINGIDRTKLATRSTDGEILLKGKSKKLGLRSGNNEVRVFDINGIGSNVFTLTF